MRSWTLERKIQVTQTRLIEWKARFNGKIYISFSGGKDSTVLADLTAWIYAVDRKMNGDADPPTLVFVNTGMEYAENQRFTKEFAEWLRTTYEIPVDLVPLAPEMTFPQVLEEYGYPVISKEVAKVIYYAKRGKGWALKRLDGLDKHGNEDDFKKRYKKYKFLLEAPFPVSPLCCDIMKKAPAHKYEAETGRKAVIATMTEESEQRQSWWLKHGCNAFDSARQTSQSMSFWTEQDVLWYIKKFRIPISGAYGEIVEADPQISLFNAERDKRLVTTSCDRTGCMYCMFGIMSDKEPNRFQRMRQTHPQQ